MIPRKTKNGVDFHALFHGAQKGKIVDENNRKRVKERNANGMRPHKKSSITTASSNNTQPQTDSHAHCSSHSCWHRHSAAAAHSPRDHWQRPGSAPCIRPACACSNVSASPPNQCQRTLRYTAHKSAPQFQHAPPTMQCAKIRKTTKLRK